MIVAIQAHEYAAYREVLDRMFRTRKAVFFDNLRWQVEADGDFERDQYDDMQPVYLVWCDSERKRHYGSMRLMPTTGPTLLYDVFGRTFPDAAELSAPGIWEGTRMCVDEKALADDYPHISPRQAFCLLLVALCEFSLASGIHTLISNYEPHVERLYRRAGATVHELGRAYGFGRFPVCCGAFEISRQVLLSMRGALRLSEPLYDRSARPIRTILADYAKVA